LGVNFIYVRSVEVNSSGDMKTVTAAILVHEGKILIARRREGDRLAGKWEFPGGTVESGETPELSLRRELKEEFDINIEVGLFVGESIYHYGHGSIRLLGFLTRWIDRDLNCRVHDRYAWVSVSQLRDYEFSPADVPFVEGLRQGDIDIRQNQFN
jgi:8-oxo-dGTP diphosphatase